LTDPIRRMAHLHPGTRLIRLGFGALMLLGLLVRPAPVLAAAGDLDTGFAGDGVARWQAENGLDAAGYGVAV